MNRETWFADIILPLAVKQTFTYRLPDKWHEYAHIGQRVVVQFGKKKFYTGIIFRLHQEVPKGYEVKYVDAFLDEFPLINPLQLKHWQWISEYYMCSLGEVMNAALPGSLKIESKTRIVINPSFEGEVGTLQENSQIVLDALIARETLTVQEISTLLGLKNVQNIIRDLLNIKAIMVEEEVKERYTPKTEEYVRLCAPLENEEALKEVFEQLEKRSPRQLEMLMQYIHLSRRYSENPVPVRKVVLQRAAGASSSTTEELVKKGVFEKYTKEIGRLPYFENTHAGSFNLSKTQSNIIASIEENWKDKDIVLLHGVTGSGKTEIYIKLIEDQLKLGKEVLYLLPEIALTTQMITRLRNYFGDQVGIYHSKFNQGERAEVWLEILKKDSRFRIILGARSALFLPFKNLGLIVVDEEHENTYKQFEPNPRYHARDAATVLAGIHNAKVLLGTATPSVESYWMAKKGFYGLVNLEERFGNVSLPDIKIARITQKKETGIAGNFTPLLLEEIKQTLEKKEQIILFQNRRGYAPMWLCGTCGWIPRCDQCDVSVTYHKWKHFLVCHYCSRKYSPPKKCPECGGIHLKMMGFGTEKIEEELSLVIPDIKISRLDLDSARSKFAFQQILDDFQEGVIDVLVGTQMVTKGLDFGNVTLVGIMDADGMLNFPDFRAHERAFQLMEQVAGRAGRREKRGKVIIQTRKPEHEVIQFLLEHNYEKLYQSQITERKIFKYPPFYRLIKIILKNRDKIVVDELSIKLAGIIKTQIGEDRVLGPEFPPVSRIRNLYLKNILIRLERNLSIHKVKVQLREILEEFEKENRLPQNSIIVDVDPR